MNQASRQFFDIVICGDGFAGVSLALALDHAFGGEIAIALVGPGQASAIARDSPRAFAISAASRALFDVIGIWPEIVEDCQPVKTIELTDSPLEAGVRPVLLTYDNHLATGEPASYIVPAAAIGKALLARLTAAHNVTVIAARIDDLDWCEARICGRLDCNRELAASLLVCAEGRADKLRTAAGLDAIAWQHAQTGIVATIAHARPHHGTAVQHFLPAGPFAILPLKGNRSCITWSEDDREAQRILALGDDAFLIEVEKRFGGKLGPLSVVGQRAHFPLATHIARSFVADRFAVIGDAAHGVHPIAGQGFNLALRDIAALTECLVDGACVGLDLGNFTLLERYQRWRRFDSATSAGAYDAINRIFARDWPLLRSAREVGLGLIDRLPGVKALLVSEAAGKTGELPAMLKGETCSVAVRCGNGRPQPIDLL